MLPVMPNELDQLTPAAHAALMRAHEKPISFGVRALVGPAPQSRLVIALGEAHLKMGTASTIGRDVVEAFGLRGVETFQAKSVFTGRALRWLIHFPRKLLRLLTLGAVKDSTITDAKQASHGYTVEIERTKRVPLSLHVAALYMTLLFGTWFLELLLAPLSVIFPPLTVLLGFLSVLAGLFTLHLPLLVLAYVARRYKWSWVIHPLIAILTARDTIMADGTVQMLKDYPKEGPAVVVMGRAHLPGFERELVERYGFRRVPFPAKA
jgi:hypothetical protein